MNNIYYYWELPHSGFGAGRLGCITEENIISVDVQTGNIIFTAPVGSPLYLVILEDILSISSGTTGLSIVDTSLLRSIRKYLLPEDYTLIKGWLACYYL